MKNILFFSALLMGFSALGQEVALAPDQNPNYKRSLAKYDSIYTQYTQQQGTTLQDTYEAIDPMEHKRKMQELRREYRAKRPLWRQERRMERIRNTRYIDTGWNNGWGWGWNRGWNPGWGYRSRWNGSFWTGTALGLGIGSLRCW